MGNGGRIMGFNLYTNLLQHGLYSVFGNMMRLFDDHVFDSKSHCIPVVHNV